jgi:hypothetical protein
MYMFIRMALSVVLCVSLGVLTLVIVKQGGKKTDNRHRTASGSVTEEKAVVAKKTTPKAITPQPKVATPPADFSNSPVVRKGPMQDNTVVVAQFQNSPVVRRPEAPKPVKVEDRHETEEQIKARLRNSDYIKSLFQRTSPEPVKVARLGPPHVLERTVRKDQTQSVVVPTDLVGYIKHHFNDAPVMVTVAKCESGIRHTLKDGSVIRGGKTPADVGLFQINTLAHGNELARLGLDPRKLEDNVRFARILYERNGLRDWAPSEHCWKKGKR